MKSTKLDMEIDDVIAFVYDDVISFHERLEEDGGEIRAGVRDKGLIESAITTPFQECFGAELYPSVFCKAAHIGYFLAKNHGFEDGNKRTALHAMLCFLLLNGFELSYGQDEIADLICAVADNKMSVEELENWISARAFRKDI